MRTGCRYGFLRIATRSSGGCGGEAAVEGAEEHGSSSRDDGGVGSTSSGDGGSEVDGWDDDYDAEVRYKQWVTTDRCTLVERIESHDDCLKSLRRQIRSLTVHHFRAQTQSAYFARMKDIIPEGEVILHGDFSENLAFIVQDAAQGFHWDRSQCTLHPFVAYWRLAGKLHHKSFCVICDDLKHDPAMVHAFLTETITRLKHHVSNITKIHYFTDGCAAQYKNRFNFVNMCHHEEDFGVRCEWNFFATSHGKGACDGIGGTVKRAVVNESLRRQYDKQILDVAALYEYLTSTFASSIEVMYVKGSKVLEVRQNLKERFNTTTVIKGTLGYHRYVPLTKSTLSVHELSEDPGRESSSKNVVIDVQVTVHCDCVLCCVPGDERNCWKERERDLSLGDIQHCLQC